MDSDSSSDSDDEFLTNTGDSGQGNVDREAMIRKKLLESFYGQSAGGNHAAAGGGSTSSSRHHHSSSSSGNANGHSSIPEQRRSSADAKDLDSPYFDVAAHTSHHVAKSSVHKLLEMDEQLTLQVRTLDSSTQNMVYENYSKFIDATEAVKSVGVNVQANEGGLERLTKGMETINEHSRLVEEELGSLRDAVAEKIRVKRLLTRLDALLKLPETIRGFIKAGKYRTAGSTFCRSTNILSKHSAGFESLQKIETECNGIMQEMMKDMNHKISHWSGQEHSLGIMGSNSEDDEDNNNNNLVSPSSADTDDSSKNNNTDDDDEIPPDPPASISEIFECAGTLAMLAREKPAGLDPGITLDRCQTMSLSASIRFLDRLFDTHQLEIQEAAFSSTLSASQNTMNVGANATVSVVDENSANAAFEGDQSSMTQPNLGHYLVPTLVMESILEACTLYSMSFPIGNDDTQQITQDGPAELVEFVTEVYGSFLEYVRTVLLEHSLSAQVAMDTATGEEEQDGDGDEVYEDVAGAMSLLLHTVREMASGLSMPEVGLSANFAANLVEQASVLTETLVRRRVEQKFCDLRLRVVNDCLVPFATRVDEKGPDASNERARVLQVVQIAVSDCLQLLDDTVRSIVSGQNVLGASAASVDLPILKQSIQASMIRFASWLGGTLEVLAGCESSDPNFSIEATVEQAADDAASNENMEGNNVPPTQTDRDDLSELSDQYDPLAEKVEAAIQDMIAEVEGKNNGVIPLAFALNICEMCRSCERAFVDSMNQSIKSNVGGSGKKGRSSGLFPMDDNKKNVVLSEHERKTTERFILASSRILTLYATDRGFDACKELCDNMASTASTESERFPERPSISACLLLEIAKLASSDCANLFPFDENKRARPMPNFSVSAPGSQPLLGVNSSALKGLQADVERMFKEEILIYPPPSAAIDFSRDAVLFILFKVAFKALAEQTRNCSFSSGGYNHLLMDLEFLREMVSHYVDDNYQMDGSNACSSLSSLLTEVLSNAGERCHDEDFDGNEDLVRTARSNLSDFMASNAAASFIMS